MERSRGIPDEEMFLSKPRPEDCDSPTVEPLRIFKPPSPQPPKKPAFKYPAPPSSSSSSSPANRPSFPLPPGASSSAAPLPFPDDDDANVRKPTPAKPYGSAYNDTSPRLDTGPFGKKPGLAERRGTAPKPIQSPTSPEDDEGLFQKPLREPPRPTSTTSYPSYRKTYYPPPGEDALKPKMSDQGVNRYSSTASTSTTRASRGSPPPPETPVVEPGQRPGDGIEARFAASGISGPGPVPQSAAASQRLAQYGGQQPPRRPWTPTETPDQAPSGPPQVYQGMDPVSSPPPIQTSFNHPPHQPSFSPPPQNLHSFTPPQHQPSFTPPQHRQSFTPPQPQQPVSPPQKQQKASQDPALQVSVLEQDFQRMGTKTPPPAYSSVNPSGSSSYPSEKQGAHQQPVATAASTQPQLSHAPSLSQHPAFAGSSAPSSSSAAYSAPPQSSSAPPEKAAMAAGAIAGAGMGSVAAAAAAGLQSPALQHPGHPAFANDPYPEQQTSMSSKPPTGPTPFDPPKTAEPPPLPEGWIAHLDQTSGQYYYIHLATQATQWDFPKGPMPISHEQVPMSPTASTYGNPLASPMFGGKQAMALGSPMFPPQTPGYAESIMSVANSVTPSMGGFSGPPPSAGVDMYRIQPTNGVYFGPYLRYVNMNIEKGHWFGSILIVTDAPQPPTIHLHLSMDLSPNPRELQPRPIYTHQRWTFYKYDIELPMGEAGTERWTYAVTSHLGCTRYEFVVAGRHELGWRFVAHSGNDFATATSQNERAKLGGVGFMWKDVLQKNVECGGYHVQLGLGDQIYGDRLWKEVPLLKQWLAMSGRDNKKNAQWTARHEEDVSHAYFHYYTSHFDQPFLREAFAQIPHVLQLDDHDIFDGYGSYPSYMQSSPIFKNIGRIATEMYLIFQHHTTVEMMRNVSTDIDIFTITGTGWHFVKFLGPAVAVIGPDCRSERTQSQVMAGPTYQGIFPKVATLPPSVQHCIWMISVPIVYPRLDGVESLANTMAVGKKAVNTTYNILGKVTSSVAGVVGGKEVVAQGFSQVKKAVGKTGLMGNVLNQFGELDIQEVLKDMWTHDTKDLERTYLIRTLQSIATQKGIRMTFLSGDVLASGAGLVHDPTHPGDHKTMYQIITSPIVAAPQGNYVLKLLHNQKTLYVPQNGKKSTHEVSDTKEDMMEIFHNDASGAPRELKKLMGRRNYVSCVVFDQDAAVQMPFSPNPSMMNGKQPQELSKLCLAVDFVVQGDGAFTAPTKYGPVVIPHLEFGR